MSFKYVPVVIAVLLCHGCAQQGAPTGGPRDEDPPVVLESEPVNYSTNFDANRIEITFDEFIVLENANQELIVSPPMEEKPEVRLRKKTIVIEIQDTLKQNTTYTFNFGSAIKDLHEGNTLLNYEYVFSTGDVLDSLSVRGTLKYARDLSVPEEPVSVMLYDQLGDSVPLKEIPLYVGRSDDSGVFSVNNLRADEYKVFALKDGNNNFLYDLPNEVIGFLDSSLTVNAEFARSLLEKKGLPDSLTAGSDTALSKPDAATTADTTMQAADTAVQAADTAVQAADTTMQAADTTVQAADTLGIPAFDLNAIYIDLLLFTEETETQYITDYTRTDPRKIGIYFAMPVTDSFTYTLTGPPMEKPVETLEYMSTERDSLTLWVTGSADYRKDTLVALVHYTVRDTATDYVTVSDTLVCAYRESKPSRRGEDAEETGQQEEWNVSTIRRNANLDLNRDIPVNLNLPLERINDSLIQLYHIPDSVEVPVAFNTAPDTLRPTRAWISAEWEPSASYRLVIYPGAFNSIYPVTHDTVDVSFSTRDNEYYGRILLSLEGVRDRVIVQLIQRERVVREAMVDEPGETVFGYLAPQAYTLKFIHDRNGNGEWDTGDYLEGRQPEDVEFLPTEINVRSNWDHDVTMQLKK